MRLEPVTHELKCWPSYYRHIASGRKTFEIRKDDRDYRAGDTLWLREWYGDRGYTGKSVYADIPYLISGFPGLAEGYVAMSLECVRTQEKR